MSSNKKSVHDGTGKMYEKQQRAQRVKEQEKKRAKSEARKAEVAAKNTVIDVTGESPMAEEHPVEVDTVVIDDVQDHGVQVVDEDDTVVIRVNATVNPTIGYGNTYNFEEGQRYRVPKHVAQHLESKGLVWH